MYAPTLVDIHSILDARINGDVFLSLNESRLERSGVSLGFQCTLMDIIKDLVCVIYKSSCMHMNESVYIYSIMIYLLYTEEEPATF